MSTAANPSTAFATVLVDELVRCGMTDAVLAPGSRSAPLAMALAADDRVRLHVRIDERSAAFLALGLARGGGRPVPVVCTSGTAAANFLPAVLEAHESGVPLLVLTADRPPELRGTGANQTVDQVKLYGAAVRWFCEVGVAEDRPPAAVYWRSLTCRAWAEATGALGAAPGPVHLNCALRDPLVPLPGGGFGAPLDGRPDGAPWTATARAPRPPAASDVEWLTERIAATPRGLLVAGDGEVAAGPLLDLARTAGWPVLAEPTSGARGGDHAVSTYHLLLGHEPFAAAHRPDLVLTVGKVGLSRPLLGLLADGVPQVVVARGGGWLDPARTAQRLVAADPELLAEAVTAQLEPPQGSDWLSGWLAAERAGRSALDGLLDAVEEPSEPRTARDLAALAPDGSLLVAASSMPVRDLNLAMRPRSGLRVVGNRGASGIDGFVSTAVGAALAHSGPALALVGDLSLLHDANGLLLAGEPAPDLVLVVIDNDGGGIFSFLPQAAFPDRFERLFGTPHGVDLARVAAAAGHGFARLDRADGLPAAVDAARSAGGLQIVGVRTDRGANAALHQRLQDAVAEALPA